MTQIVNENKDVEEARRKLEEITGGQVPDFWKKLFPDKDKGDRKRDDVEA